MIITVITAEFEPHLSQEISHASKERNYLKIEEQRY